ncbi:MAG: hypothetical protein K5899_00925 [Bacteroidaceae bacterium]|nr:hypothetical protein [Bacteroidaceae bacterium]
METLTFNEFPTLRVIQSEWYDESDKQLSFAYRDENLKVDDGLRAFIAMKRENAPIQLEGVGCKIMGYYIRKRSSIGLVYGDLPILCNKLFEEAIDSIVMWSDTNGTVFDYYWFDYSDSTMELLEYIDEPQREGNIVYFVIQR